MAVKQAVEVGVQPWGDQTEEQIMETVAISND